MKLRRMTSCAWVSLLLGGRTFTGMGAWAGAAGIIALFGFNVVLDEPEFLLLCGILAVVSLWAIYTGQRERVPLLALLRRGVVTHGRLINHSKPEDGEVTTLEFQFEVGGRHYTVSAKTKKPGLLMDDAMEPLVYMNKNPGKATMLDHLPGRLSMTDQLVNGSCLRAAGAIFVLLLALASTLAALLGGAEGLIGLLWGQ